MNTTIEIFPWNSNFETGVPVIDEQHQKLVALINKLASHLAYTSSDDLILNQVLDELTDYAVYHFETEEALWRKYLPVDEMTVEHQQTHQSFIDEICKARGAQSSLGSEKIIEDILSFLIHWLAFHILDDDMRMAKIVLAVQQDMSLQDARAQANLEMSGATELLIETVLIMYDSLASRTLQLMREIAQHKQTEARSLEQSNLLEMFYKHTHDCIVLLDREFNFIRVNEAYAKACDRDVSEFPGHNHFEFYPSELIETFQNVVKTKEPFHIQARPFTFPDHSDWGVTYWDLSLTPVLDDVGEVEFLLFTLKDVTKFKVLEEQLLQSQKMEAMGTLVGGIAHDFNNTLAAIQGNLYLAKEEMDEKDALTMNLANIEKLSARAAEMVKQLLTFARKDVVSTRPFSLTSFMKEGCKLSKNIIPENIDYTINLRDEELIIHGDPTQLQQVLINLLNNARDAVRNTSRPKIVCTLDSFSVNAEFEQKYPGIKGERVAHLTIEDNGYGISEDALAQIFMPFFTTKGVGEGTGLGLAMVYGSVQTHGGAIEVDSREGEGTAFHIYLPLSQDDEKLIEESEDAIVSGEGETILLADDETDVRETTGKVLSSLGYKVLLAADGEDAVELFKANADDIDMIISDIVMPKMGGIDAAKQIRLLNSKVPVIFATGYDKDQSATSRKKIERSMIISKPFSFEALSQSIRKMIAS